MGTTNQQSAEGSSHDWGTLCLTVEAAGGVRSNKTGQSPGATLQTAAQTGTGAHSRRDGNADECVPPGNRLGTIAAAGKRRYELHGCTGAGLRLPRVVPL